MARLERGSLTRWENGKPVTYYRGDEVPDLKPAGDPEKPNVFLTREEGAKAAPRTKAPATTSETNDTSNLDIIELLEGNAESVKARVAKETDIAVLEEILVAEGEGKNRSTVTSAINDRIKALEEEG